MLADDGALWVVKFLNNPQHVRVLANEMITTKLGEDLGLPVATCGSVQVDDSLLSASVDMWINTSHGRVPYASGLQFGSRFAGGMMPGQIVDYLPESYLANVRNIEDFWGMLCLDKWTNNCDGRQAVFQRDARKKNYSVVFVDHGFCFNLGEWNFLDTPLRGVYSRNSVYEGVSGWESFEPWLTRIETFSMDSILSIFRAIPPEWCGGNTSEVEGLAMDLYNRRSKVRELIDDFRRSNREPFPNWK